METETLTTTGLPVSSTFAGLATLPVGTRVTDRQDDAWVTAPTGLVSVWDCDGRDTLVPWAEVRDTYPHCASNEWTVQADAAAEEIGGG